MQTKIIHYYDDQTLEHVAQRFFIDGEEVSFEDYVDFAEGLNDGDCEDTDDCTEDEVNCCECDKCPQPSIEELLDIYTERLQGLICPHCIKEVLEDFLTEIINDD